MPMPLASPAKPTTSVIRRDIQGLRAIAVLLVVCDHFFLVPLGGYIGVDVFFVISGYLITGVLLRGERRSGRVSLTSFYGQRARRILPAGTLVLVLTVVAAFVLWPLPRATQTLLDSLAAGVFVSNWHLIVLGTDYLQATDALSPVQHYWSLAVEEQFYIVWPLLLMGLLWVSRFWTTSGRRRLLISTLVLLGLISFALSAMRQSSDPSAAYFDSVGRAWELAAGALLAVTTSFKEAQPDPTRHRRLRRTVALLGLAVVFCGAAALSTSSSFPYPWAIVPVAGTAGVIWAHDGFVSRVLGGAPVQFFGRISYSLYLWHFPIAIFGGALLGDSLVSGVGLLIASVAVSAMSERFVEAPFRAHRTSPGPVRLDAVVAVSVAGLILGMVGLQLKGPSLVRSSTAALAAFGVAPPLSTFPVSRYPDEASLTAMVTEAARASRWPDLSPSPDELTPRQAPPQMSLAPTGCRNDVSSTEGPRLCVAGSPSAKRTVALVGDSVALSWAPTVEQALVPQGWRVVSFGYASCPLVNVPVNQRTSNALFPANCQASRDRTLKELNRLKPDLIVVSSSEGSLLYLESGATGRQAQTEWQRGTERMLATLSRLQADVIVLGAPPRVTDPTACLTRIGVPATCLSTLSSLTYEAAEAARSAVAASTSLQGRGPTYIDVRGWFCTTSGECPAFVGNTMLRTDSTHLTMRAAQMLAGAFATEVNRAVGNR